MREPIHETLVEAALYIGHEMGRKHESMAGDSREFIDALCEKCYEFETEWQHLGEEGYYIDAVETFAEQTLEGFREDEMVDTNHGLPTKPGYWVARLKKYPESGWMPYRITTRDGELIAYSHSVYLAFSDMDFHHEIYIPEDSNNDEVVD